MPTCRSAMLLAWAGTLAGVYPHGRRRTGGSHNIDELLTQVLAAAQPGDHLLCMSNGGFGNVHQRLLSALNT